jgi:anti-anti-sigma factor
VSNRETFFVTFPGVRALALHGELDAGTSWILEDATLTWVGTEGALALHLDDLSFIDSTGVRTLMAVAESLPEGNLELRNPQRVVRRVFGIVDIEAVPNITVLDGPPRQEVGTRSVGATE